MNVENAIFSILFRVHPRSSAPIFNLGIIMLELLQLYFARVLLSLHDRLVRC
jgi:hypothetical protein